MLTGLLLSPAASAQADRELVFEIDSVSYSEASSLRSISGHWNDSVSSGDIALSYSRLTLGVETGNFVVQYLQRYETVYEYDNETAEFLFLVENQEPLTAGDRYRLEIKPKRAETIGLRLGYRFHGGEDFTAAVFLSLLKPRNLLEGDLVGSAVAIGPGDYDFDFSSDLVYREDPLYERGRDDLSGDGYAIDLSLSYGFGERWRLSADFFDLAGELSLDNAPFTTADATSDIKTFDENGFVVFDPVISGLEGNRDYTYEFDMHSHIKVGYSLDQVNHLAMVHHQYTGFDYQEINWARSYADRQIVWQWIPRLEVVGAAWIGPDFRIGLATDQLDFAEMKYFSLTGAYYWRF